MRQETSPSTLSITIDLGRRRVVNMPAGQGVSDRSRPIRRRRPDERFFAAAYTASAMFHGRLLNSPVSRHERVERPGTCSTMRYRMPCARRGGGEVARSQVLTTPMRAVRPVIGRTDRSGGTALPKIGTSESADSASDEGLCR